MVGIWPFMNAVALTIIAVSAFVLQYGAGNLFHGCNLYMALADIVQVFSDECCGYPAGQKFFRLDWAAVSPKSAALRHHWHAADLSPALRRRIASAFIDHSSPASAPR